MDENLNPYCDLRVSHYDTAMSRDPSDVAIRRAFQHLARREIERESLILDFGAGTGTDALQYADHGYRVHLHDPSTAMLAIARRKLDGEATAGRVSFSSGTGPLGPQLPTTGVGPISVTANFAVLNLLHEPARGIRALAALVSPGCCLIASILNPWRRQYWRHLGPPFFFRGNARISRCVPQLYLLRAGAIRRWLGPDFDVSVARPEPPPPGDGLSRGDRYLFFIGRKHLA